MTLCGWQAVLPAATSTLVWALAWVLFAAGVRATLQAALLAVASGSGEAVRWHWLGCADVGFDSNFFRHERLRVEMGENPDFKLPQAVSVAEPTGLAGCAGGYTARPKRYSMVAPEACTMDFHFR